MDSSEMDMIRSKCALCGESATLRNSHIFPEFLYRELYGDKRQMFGIHGRGRDGYRPLQKGLRDRLLCDACEQHLNDHFEKPFLRWYEAQSLPENWREEERRLVPVAYGPFKLFHLSILFRAGVSSLATFREVRLGARHEGRLRHMLLHRDAGRPDEYGIRGSIIIDTESRQPFPLITRPQKVRLHAHTFYGMAYANVDWWIRVSSHREFGTDPDLLTDGGMMPLVAKDWHRLPILHLARDALNQPCL
jgi:hypothetical protein